VRAGNGGWGGSAMDREGTKGPPNAASISPPPAPCATAGSSSKAAAPESGGARRGLRFEVGAGRARRRHRFSQGEVGAGAGGRGTAASALETRMKHVALLNVCTLSAKGLQSKEFLCTKSRESLRKVCMKADYQ
jgi:hypothetical protein